jgi:uncharacterized protein DUF6455
MSSALGVVLAVVALSLTGALAFAFLAGWRRIMQDEGPLPLFAMLDRRGTAVAQQGLEPQTLAHAARRCAFCGYKQECREWFASAQSEPCPPYCLNASLL